MSLPVGSFSWRNRWTYDDDKHRMPFEIGPLPHQVAAREEFEKTMISATTASADPALAVQPQAHHRPTPRVLSQYRHPNDKPASVYTESYKPLLSRDSFARIVSPAREKLPEGVHERALHMWYRVNPAHFVLPMEAESASNYVNHRPQRKVAKAGFQGMAQAPTSITAAVKAEADAAAAAAAAAAASSAAAGSGAAAAAAGPSGSKKGSSKAAAAPSKPGSS